MAKKSMRSNALEKSGETALKCDPRTAVQEFVAPRVKPKAKTPTARDSARPKGAGGSRRKAAGDKQNARRAAILSAALDEFTTQGFAAARIDDIARRAGVAKGTVYLYFEDKEALFQELVRTMLVPLVSTLELAPPDDVPVRERIERLFAMFVNEVYGTRRAAVVRLVLAEGPRFPALAEFYYRNVIERGLAAIRALTVVALARGEIENRDLAVFPHLVVAPAIVAIVYSGLFDRFAALEIERLMRAHLDLLFGPRRPS